MKALLFVLLGFIAWPAVAQDFESGVHYETLPVPVTTTTDKIEVVEVFSYACVHCFNFDSRVKAWSSALPDDIEFVRIPAVFNQRAWSLLAQAFYTAEVLGVSAKVHDQLFAAVHLEGVDLRRPGLLGEFFQRTAGVTPEKFEEVFESFGVKSRVQQADAKVRMFRVTGVPTMIVNGKYRIDGQMAGDNTRMLEVVDELIARERALRAGSE